MASICTTDLPRVDSLFNSGTKSEPAIYMKPPAATGNIMLENSATLEPIESDMTVPRIANKADTKLKNSAFLFVKPA